MDEKDDEQECEATEMPEVVEMPDEDINLHEANQLDEILGSAPSEKVKMLEFERQMFMDSVYNDGLVICGK